jgi:hypothetical protein
MNVIEKKQVDAKNHLFMAQFSRGLNGLCFKIFYCCVRLKVDIFGWK